MPSSLRFLLFRIHLIGMTMSKDVSFNSNNFSSNYFSRSFTFWSILIILIHIIVNTQQMNQGTRQLMIRLLFDFLIG